MDAPITTGMIGDGNYEADHALYRGIHRKGSVSVVSQHRRALDTDWAEVDLAADINRPILFGEVYHKAYDPGCEPLEDGPSVLERAADIEGDLDRAVDQGVDGYLLWELNGGRVGDREYCTEFGFELDDPLWDRLRSDALPPDETRAGRGERRRQVLPIRSCRA